MDNKKTGTEAKLDKARPTFYIPGGQIPGPPRWGGPPATRAPMRGPGNKAYTKPVKGVPKGGQDDTKQQGGRLKYNKKRKYKKSRKTKRRRKISKRSKRSKRR